MAQQQLLRWIYSDLFIDTAMSILAGRNNHNGKNVKMRIRYTIGDFRSCKKKKHISDKQLAQGPLTETVVPTESD